jgi:hypothetical protein
MGTPLATMCKYCRPGPCWEKRQDHLFGPACLDSCFCGAWFPLGDPLFGLFFSLRRVIQHHGFVHGDNVVEHSEGVAVDGSDEVPAVLDTLNFLFLRQQFGYPAGRLFFKAQTLMQDTMNGPHANSMGDSKRFHAQAAILHSYIVIVIVYIVNGNSNILGI